MRARGCRCSRRRSTATALSVELERIDNFAEALHAGHVLPEDF
jgi:hypothetical protein